MQDDRAEGECWGIKLNFKIEIDFETDFDTWLQEHRRRFSFPGREGGRTEKLPAIIQ